MDNISLGRLLKNARLSKKMTQSEVAGSFISRNMLSLIESGSATPSLKTLEYLSNVLEIPLEQLVAPKENSAENQTLSASLPNNVFSEYIKLKQSYNEGNYKEVCSHISEFIKETHPFYDEGCALYARCCLALGLAAFEEKDFKRAFSLAKAAGRFGAAGCYASRDICTQAYVLLDDITTKAQEIDLIK